MCIKPKSTLQYKNILKYVFKCWIYVVKMKQINVNEFFYILIFISDKNNEKSRDWYKYLYV